MTSATIQDILQRIEKLKGALQEKNHQLEERDQLVALLKNKLAEQEERIHEANRDAEESKVKLAALSNSKSEAYVAAERVEAITAMQREMQKLREENRALKAKARDVNAAAATAPGATSPGHSTNPGIVAGGSNPGVVNYPEGLRERDELIEDQRRQLRDGDRENKALRDDIAKLKQKLATAQAGQAAAAAGAGAGSASDDAAAWEAVAAEQQRQINDLSAQVADADEKDSVIADLMMQLAESQELVEERRRKARELEAVVAEQMQQIVELSSGA